MTTSPTPPETRRDETADLLHGHLVPDPYRWLEDPDSEDTRRWVREQNEATEAALAALPQREWFRATLSRLLSRPTVGTPRRSHGLYLVNRNDGSQPQDVWYAAETLGELEQGGGRVLVDPNTLSPDQTAALGSLSVSPDGTRVAWTVGFGGSDWQQVRLSTAEGEELDEPPVMSKFSSPVWLPDGRSYLYVAYPEAERAEAAGTETGAVGRSHLMRHRLGTDPSTDELVHTDPTVERQQLAVRVSDDDRWLITCLYVGTENRNRVWLWPLEQEAGGTRIGAPLRALDVADAEYEPVAVVGERLLLQTDLDAPRGRVVALDLARLREDPADVVLDEVLPADDRATLQAAVVAGGVLVTSRLVDASPVLQRWGLDGSPLGTLDVQGGALVALEGDPDSSEGFVGLSTVTEPVRSWRFDAATGEVRELSRPESGLAPLEVEYSRLRARSADGTEVPCTLVRPRGATGPLPTLLWGYGGFKIPVAADYRPGFAAWLAAGGAVAVANLRGGGEFGTDWYDQGRLHAKQNVFDDFVAVAEHLVASGATGERQLVIHGRSNGGLLVGAVMTQRPDLAAVALPSVGVLDMFRFHRFTIGGAWRSD
ncbi:prolyl oligopeptidase family serine peptidase, partial [Auraticoccus cholistanensis]|uniref:prolyl oligopeptidase family serine peptidase n=1 Tax=Auraticoccus cholistanensis TaxID=2656650 RepID=UPI002F91B9C6